MIRRKTGTAIAFLLAAAFTAPGIGRAQTADASANYALTDPATGKTGSVQVTATAIVTENLAIQYVTPMKLGLSGNPGESATLRMITVGKANGRTAGRRDAQSYSPSLAVQGLPNQVFAISIEQASRGINGPDGSMIASFTHNAGQTPHIGPAGDTQLMIGATLRLSRNTVRRGYSGTLDVIVSHN